MLYFAHRGASAYRTQNTLPAFALACACGATHYELDVHLLKDGRLAVHHDYEISTAAGQLIPLAELTAADLPHYPLATVFNERATVPLLEEVFPLISLHLELLNIELKNDDNRYPGLEERVLRAVPPTLFPRVLFSSFSQDSLARLRALSSRARIGLLTRQFDVSRALALRAESIHINHTRFTPAQAQTAHAHGLRLYCYTVNDNALALQLAAHGVDGIFTDRVVDFLAPQ